jgi:predicted GNAT family N-acyltransferase
MPIPAEIIVRPIENETEREACFAIRHTVFVGEQNVPVELERDEYDGGGAIHFIALVDGKAEGTGRLRVMGDWAKIQRVAVSPGMRGTGLGAQIMQQIEEYVRRECLASAITLGAQIDAAGFYERLGYVRHGDEFDDAGIVHIEMRKQVG